MIILLVYLIIFCAVIWAARAILAAFGIGDPIRTIVMVVIVLFALLALLNLLGFANIGSLGTLRGPS